MNRLRSLAPQFSSLAAQAVEGHLAFVKAPPLDADYGIESAEFFKDLANVRLLTITYFMLQVELVATVKYRVGGVHHVQLNPASSTGVEQSVNGQMVKNGWAVVDAKAGKRHPEVVKTLMALQDDARRGHLGCFEYGDFSLDGDEPL